MPLFKPPPEKKPGVPQPVSQADLGTPGMFGEIRKLLSSAAAHLARISRYSQPPLDALLSYSLTSTVATLTKPVDQDVLTAGGNPGYDQILIFFDGQRISDKTYVTNDGPASLFVVSSYDLKKWSGETEIRVGETWEFYNVRELRTRSPSLGNAYRVSEYKLDPTTHQNALKAKIDVNTQGDNLIIAAPGTGLRIRIVSLVLSVAVSTNLILKSGTTALTGAMTITPAAGLMDAVDTQQPLDMNPNEGFTINLSAGNQTSGYALYIIES